MQAHMHTRMHACTYLHRHTCMHACMHAHTHARTHAYMHAHAHTQVYLGILQCEVTLQVDLQQRVQAHQGFDNGHTWHVVP